MDEEKSLIVVTQLPIIEERLREVKAEVETIVDEAKSLIATADTVQAVKNRRAELNKQFEALETQRKAVKRQIMDPYERFNAVYEECVAGPFRAADKTLKATIDEFESELKAAALDRLKSYYVELCESERIDWIPFERALSLAGIRLTLADTKTREPKKKMDELAHFVAVVATDMDQIRKMDDSADIMAEYKITLDTGRAVANVQDRRRRAQAEREAAEARREEDARRAEAIAKVEAAAQTGAVAAPIPVQTPPGPESAGKPFPPKLAFTLYFDSPQQFQAVKPVLLQLRDIMRKEGIRYE